MRGKDDETGMDWLVVFHQLCDTFSVTVYEKYVELPCHLWRWRGTSHQLLWSQSQKASAVSRIRLLKHTWSSDRCGVLILHSTKAQMRYAALQKDVPRRSANGFANTRPSDYFVPWLRWPSMALHGAAANLCWQGEISGWAVLDDINLSMTDEAAVHRGKAWGRFLVD